MSKAKAPTAVELMQEYVEVERLLSDKAQQSFALNEALKKFDEEARTTRDAKLNTIRDINHEHEQLQRRKEYLRDRLNLLLNPLLNP